MPACGFVYCVSTDAIGRTQGRPSGDAGSAADEELEVLVAPDYRDSNPYQEQLATGLTKRGATVSTASGSGYLFPFSRMALRGGRPDVFHLHFFAPYMIVGDDRLRRLRIGWLVTAVLGVSLLLDLAVLRLCGVGTVWTAHDLTNHERRYVRTETAVKRVAVRFLLDRVVVHCETAGEEVRETLGLADTAGKFRVIPHGHFLDSYPDDLTQAEARDRLDLEDAGTVFAFFGWIRPYKNVPRLVEQFKRLEDPRARLLVVGQARSADLERRVRAACADDDRVHATLEFVPDEEVQLYMNAADAVVLPFRTEEDGGRSLLTSGSVILAMGFHNAVVAPAVGCVGDLLDSDRGVPYPPDAHDQPYRAMRSLLGADLDGMGARNYQLAVSLDWNSIARRTLQTYRNAER